MDIGQALNQALSHHQAGRLGEAEQLYRLVLASEPAQVDALQLLGMLVNQRGEHEAAVELIRRAIELNPEHHVLHYNLGVPLLQLGRVDEAIAAYQRAVQLKPDDAQARDSLGGALVAAGRPGEAIEEYLRAIGLAPDFAQGHYNLGIARFYLEQFAAAAEAFGRAIELAPADIDSMSWLAAVDLNLGMAAEAVEVYRRALAIQPGNVTLIQGLLMTLHYPAEVDPLAIFTEHARFGKMLTARSLPSPSTLGEGQGEGSFPVIEAEPSPLPSPGVPGEGEKLRIGYVSGDFNLHPVGREVFPVLQNHDRERFEVFCFSNTAREDEGTRQIQSLPLSWHSIRSMDDPSAAELIRSLGIDILVDLSGHTKENRIALFAHKPAPVQVTWLGYPDTTGLDAIDWRITDGHADSPGQADALHTERLWRLPEVFLCYPPPQSAPEIDPPPVERTGAITFGNFNNIAKITPRMAGVYGRIISSVAGSRLMLRLNSQDPATRGLVLDRLARAGLPADRVLLLGRAEGEQHLRRFGEVDIAMDCFPYHGTATTFETLWMGVPLITLAGSTHVSRVGVSILKNLGLDEWIAADEKQFVELAIRLADDRARLREIRMMLRQRMRDSVLCDGLRFTRQLEAAYLGMWSQFRGG